MPEFYNYFTDDSVNLNNVDIQTLVSARLEDMADQIFHLLTEGYHEEAELLKREGLELAEALDNGTPFFYINDLTGV